MCESEKQCCEGQSCVERVDRTEKKLKKLVWALMIWVFILSLGLGASIAHHFILGQRPDKTDKTPPKNTDATSGTHSQLTSYNPIQNKQDNHYSNPQWQKTNGYKQDTAISIEDDGNYFLFLRFTLQNRKQGVNYTVTVKKMPLNQDIIVGHINGTELSTGFMGRGVHLSKNTLLNVTCSPQTQIDVHNTYLGLIKF
ncbi:hypothetical protein Baya_14344 [Bagarius yarrelli]|uniref:TNF family profile domain-containing protein n=1 Tax=Bagarius yarrelli TaxID=175774 RepID=A0A556V8X4_BAGYA|nr:hypothetical protein Baya_14344 [Bagarius yarrelli]